MPTYAPLLRRIAGVHDDLTSAAVASGQQVKWRSRKYCLPLVGIGVGPLEEVAVARARMGRRRSCGARHGSGQTGLVVDYPASLGQELARPLSPRPRATPKVGVVGRRAFTVGLFALCAQPALVLGDARSSYLVSLLKSSSQFRVRAQAAISLGTLDASREAVGALADALDDDHPAVRVAAASSLGRLGDQSAIARLEQALRDRDEPVRNAAKQALASLSASSRSGSPGSRDVVPGSGGPRPAARDDAKYYVAVGQPASAVPAMNRASLVQMRRILTQRLASVEGVEVAPNGESEKQVQQLLTSRRMKGFFLETSVTQVQKRPDGGTRVAVSIILATYPGRDMRAILQGAATAVGSGNSDLEQALEGAVAGALRRLPQAMAR